MMRMKEPSATITVQRIDIERPAKDEVSDWNRLVDAWQEMGYGDAPPRCMAEYADAVIGALSLPPRDGRNVPFRR